MRKPERGIYELTCQRMGIVPTEAVFIDDLPDNVAAAERFGLRGIVRGPATDLEAELLGLGVRPQNRPSA